MPKTKSAMTSYHYKVFAEIINKLNIPPEQRLTVANHFATEFRKRFSGFDPLSWENVTGGKIQGYNINTGKFDE
jgi:hypothetical protein